MQPEKRHFGIISPPVSGHIHPFGALGRELIARGHQVTVFHMPDLAAKVKAEGLDFVAIGAEDHPEGSLPESLARLARLEGLPALRFTIRAICQTTEMICRAAPTAVRASGVDLLLVDQTQPAGGSVAQHLRIPFVTICNALALNREGPVPPPFTGWTYRDSLWARARNRLGYAISDRMMRPVARILNRYRKGWSLPKLARPEDSFSELAQISQLPAAFDFPRRELPACFHYVGPLRDGSRTATAFPWERLDGRPLVYASLGTLQNRREQTFRCFAEACKGLDVQLVITHGGGLDEKAASALPGDPVVVPYAPQLEVLARARLALTHAGLNTVLDALTHGVPLVAVPITYEQPAIASRVEWCGAGKVIPHTKLKVETLRSAIVEVLSNPAYRERAGLVKKSIQEAGGTRKAVDLIEKILI